MGKVYKFSEITEYKVPRLENFARTKAIALDELSRLASQEIIYGAKVFGSVGKGNPNMRSDFDIIIITQSEINYVFPLLKEIFLDILKRTSVEIEPLIITREFAETGQHTIDNLYFRHIKSIPDDGNIAGNNPVDILKPYDLSPTEVHKQYINSKVRSLTERYFSQSEEDKYIVLQRALEAPVNTGRRTLQALPYLGCRIEIGDDGKQAVIKAFKKTFGDTELMLGFNFLLNQDQEYSSLLQDAMEGSVSRESYEDFVNVSGEECGLMAINWEGLINRAYRTLLEGRHKLQEGNVIQHRGKESLG